MRNDKAAVTRTTIRLKAKAAFLMLSALLVLGLPAAGLIDGAEEIKPADPVSAETVVAVMPETPADPGTEPPPTFMDATDQLISAGDIVRMTMVEDEAVKYEGPVSTSGTIRVPYYGEFRIAGMTESEAGRRLSEELVKDLYQAAHVSVVLVSRGAGSVYVYGAVGKPGQYPIPQFGQFTILRLMLLCGGLSGWADAKSAFILRFSNETGNVQRVNVNLSEIFATAIPYTDRDIQLRDGDIVCVPGLNGELFQFMMMEDREVIIIGEVGSPGPVTFAPGEPRTAMRAFFKVGGFSQFAKKSAVRIFRYEDNGERTERVINAEEIVDEGKLHKDVKLKPGDVIIVPQKKINF